LQDFRRLQVWQKAHVLTLEIYANTNTLPKDELFGLRSQMRRSAASIGTNIAEGCGRYGDAELSRFLLIAMGSASELEYQLLLCRDLRYIDATVYSDLDRKTGEIKRMLAVFANKLDTPRSRKVKQIVAERLKD
jgi:four helix bundle protein